jgi:RNA polymerase sigma factor (TIGR02999 family)
VNKVGGPEAAALPRALIDSIYHELRTAARPLLASAPRGVVLQPTSLLHEALLRILASGTAGLVSREQLACAVAQAMRSVLIDEIRRMKSAKRGGGWGKIELQGLAASAEAGPVGVDLPALDAAMRALEALHPRQVRVVEMRFFAGMAFREIAEVLGVSLRTVTLDWEMARAFLRGQLSGSE